MPWSQFRPWFIDQWQVGEHVTGVAMTGAGKTTLFRNLINTGRDFCVVFGTKARDDALYKPLVLEGFVLVDKWSPWDWEQTGQRKIIFAPMLRVHAGSSPQEVKDAEEDQAEAFRVALVQIFIAGGWCCYFDEIRYLSDDLGLAHELNRLYLQGRSLGVTMVAATQRPRSVPLNTFAMATWFFLWKISDRDDRRRASEFAGEQAPLAFETSARMPKREFVCVNAVDELIVRSKVEL
jgi:hypothetical protein